MKDLRVVFMGTPDFAVPVLQSLIDNCNVVMVVTQPDKLVGRKQVLTYSPVKKLALEYNIPVFQPEKIKKDYQVIMDINPDIIITCAFGQIIPDILLHSFKYESINVHASLLPKLRGGAPIHHAIIDGEKETGITIMYMDSLMDNGDIISQVKTEILDTDTVSSLHDRLMNMAPILLISTLKEIISGTNNRIKQDEAIVTFGLNIKREEERVDFNLETKKVFNHIRGLNPYPSANCLLNGLETKLYDVTYELGSFKGMPGEIIEVNKDSLGIKCLDGIVRIYKIKPFGKGIMSVKDYLNGVDKKSLMGVVLNEEK